MKNVITLGILLTATIFIISCGDSTEDVKSTAGGKPPKEKTPQEKIVGEWELPGTGTMTFESDGTFIPPDDDGERGKWELLGDGEPFKLIITQEGDSNTANMTFISDDEIEVEFRGRKDILKRKG